MLGVLVLLPSFLRVEFTITKVTLEVLGLFVRVAAMLCGKFAVAEMTLEHRMFGLFVGRAAVVRGEGAIAIAAFECVMAVCGMLVECLLGVQHPTTFSTRIRVLGISMLRTH